VERGQQHCEFARFLEYHSGPYHLGIVRRAVALPLATGTYTHLGCTAIAEWLMEYRQRTGIQPDRAPDDLIRWAASMATDRYREVIDKGGFLHLADEDPNAAAEMRRTIEEQSALVEGLVWVWASYRLPQILAEYLVVAVEEEQEYVVGCTCGLGDSIGGFREHADRTCSGVGLQSRPDLLLERRIDHAWAYMELKTAGTAWRNWSNQFETSIQLLIGILGAEKRHGVEITHCRIDGLVKGRRSRDYPYEDSQPKTQQSPLCYAYWEAPNPPLTIGDWLPASSYIDREGIRHSVPRGRDSRYKRIGLWEAPEEAFPNKPPEMSRSEYIVKYWAENYPHHIERCIAAIGPIPKKRDQLDKGLRALVANEQLWMERLWRLHEWRLANGNKGWGDPDYHRFLETVVPRSWHCWPYDGQPCPYLPLCFEEGEGWRDPTAGAFIERTPHHTAEYQLAESRGWKPPEGLPEESGEDD
jgi:hypothetical protein